MRSRNTQATMHIWERTCSLATPDLVCGSKNFSSSPEENIGLTIILVRDAALWQCHLEGKIERLTALKISLALNRLVDKHLAHEKYQQQDRVHSLHMYPQKTFNKHSESSLTLAQCMLFPENAVADGSSSDTHMMLGNSARRCFERYALSAGDCCQCSVLSVLV